MLGLGFSVDVNASPKYAAFAGSVALAGSRRRRSQRPPSGASPDRDDARSALLDDGIDDALGDVDDGLADPREAAVQLATRDPLRAVLDAE